MMFAIMMSNISLIRKKLTLLCNSPYNKRELLWTISFQIQKQIVIREFHRIRRLVVIHPQNLKIIICKKNLIQSIKIHLNITTFVFFGSQFLVAKIHSDHSLTFKCLHPESQALNAEILLKTAFLLSTMNCTDLGLS